MSGFTSVLTDSLKLVLGVLWDMSRDKADIISAKATTAIGVGTYAELSLAADGSWTCAAPAGATTTMAKGGIACLENVREPSAGVFAIGDIVPILRKGRIVAACETGMTEPTTFDQVANIMHSSAVATNRGKFTSTATSVGAGTEIQASSDKTTVTFVRIGDAATGLCVVEINAP